MPGSCNSEKSSSPSLISSLRRFRFQNKAKQPQQGETSTQTSSAIGNPTRSADSSLNSQKSSSAAYNPLSYRKYENPNDTLVLLQSISAKIQTLLRNNTTSSVLDLKLTVEEAKKLKNVVLQHPGISMKWSFNVSEHADTDTVDKVLKVKRLYMYELSKYVTDALNSKFSKNNKAQFAPESSHLQNYSRPKRPEGTVSRSPINNSSSSDSQSQGAMDDYEEFCEKEQCLRKMLDAFPGSDIMEAQDILVKCKWDLNKAILEARNQPLRTTRKRGSTGSFVPQPQTPANMPNQRPLVNASQSTDSKNVPEEIVLDSSDDEDLNGNASQKSSSSVSSNAQSHNEPPPKRVRRLISTDSEDEVAASVSKAVPTASSQTQKPAVPSVQMKTTLSAQPKIPSSVQPKAPLAVQQKNISSLPKVISVEHKPVPPVQSNPVPPKQPTTVRTSSSNSSSVEKTINLPQSLSIKPVPNSSSTTNSDKPATSAMPTLPKGLVITQVGGMDNKRSEKEGSPTNVNNSNSIPVNSKKSAQLIRIKPSSGVSGTSSALQGAIATVTSTAVMNKTNSNKTYTIPKTQGVSITPVNKVSIIPKALVITPVGLQKESSVNEKFPESSTEDESSSDAKSRINNQDEKKDTIKESNDFKNSNESNDGDHSQPSEAANSFKEHENNSKHNPGKRKRFSSDEEDDEEYGNEDIYDSEDSDCEENLTSAHSAVLKFFQESTAEELGTVPGCSKKKIEAIINLRPFTKWIDLVEKLKNDKALSTDLLNGAKKVLDMRNSITKLMTKCQRISLDMEDLVENLKENKETSSDYVSEQPSLLNERMHLTGYQMLGLNWLLLMHNQEVNAILADEMGLGKTVQAISFLAYLKQIEEEGPHLIVVPSSTLDNWKKELETWWPTVSVICYHGQQESRRDLRMQILNDEVDEFDVMITTYNMVTSSAEDRNFFKRLEFNYVVFDEAHMLKNMASQRYINLMRIKAPRRLLLTGTPLQNNLVELMSLLIFAMPHMFSGKTEQIKQMFSCVSKATGSKNSYEKDRIDHAKRIMKPFVLRRLKRDVLKELPQKHDETRYCPMVEDQAQKYEELVKRFSAEVQVESSEKDPSSSGAGMMMQLRRGANHPLLLRKYFDDDKLLIMAQKMLKEPTHCQSDPNIVFEDMAVMSDFELHKLCKQYKSINSFALSDDAILNSGKLKVLDELLPDLIKEDHRILLFSQFTMVLDIIQEYMNIRNYKYLRLDGQVPVSERQQLIDEFNNDPEILVFLLSTRAGGLGINLTAADTVILHDIDFNPYNDKQAEDRCHRVGQVRNVKVIRMISDKTIEEGILQRAKDKLKLEKDIHDEGDDEENDTASVAMLLRDALGLKPSKS